MKNFQLVTDEDANSVILQFGKVGGRVCVCCTCHPRQRCKQRDFAVWQGGCQVCVCVRVWVCVCVSIKRWRQFVASRFSKVGGKMYV